MPSQTIMLELPEHLYRTVRTLAQVTKRPVAEILQESLAHTLPPLDDVPPEEAERLAYMSPLDDAALWEASTVAMPKDQQEALHTFIDDRVVRLEDALTHLPHLRALPHTALHTGSSRSC